MSNIDKIKGEIKAGVDFIMKPYEEELKEFCEMNNCSVSDKIILKTIKNKFNEDLDLEEVKILDFTLLKDKIQDTENKIDIEIKEMLRNLLDDLREFKKEKVAELTEGFTVVSGNKTYKDYIIYALIIIAVISLFKFFSTNKDKINNRFN